MGSKDNSTKNSIFEVRHFTSGSARSGNKNIIVEKVLPGSETARFMERMEIHRLKRQCHQAIDMRGKSSGTVRAYFYSNLTHWLDDDAHRIFRQSMASNRGTYTIGAYETIVGHRLDDRAPPKTTPARTVRSKVVKNTGSESRATPTTPTPIPPIPTTIPIKDHHEYFKRKNAEPVPFGYYRKRKEQRFIHKLAVELIFGESEFKGETLDFSFHGLQLTFDDNVALTIGDTVEVRFRFENMATDESHPCAYRVVAIGKSNRQTIVATALSEDEESENFNRIKQFFSRIANRAKIDPSDEVTTARAQLFQHAYASSAAQVPVFFRIDSEGKPWIEALAKTQNNSDALSIFKQESDHYDFAPLQIPSRIAHLCYTVAAAGFSYDATMPDDRPIGELNIVVFKDAKGSLHSIAEHEVSEPAEWGRLVRYSFVNKHHKIYKLLVSFVKEHNRDKVTIATQELVVKDADTAKSLTSSFRGFIAVGQLTDVTNDYKFWLRNGANETTNDIALQGLSTWVNGERRNTGNAREEAIATETLLPAPELVDFGEVIVRREERLIARTKAEISVKGKRYAATTRDMSNRGLSMYIDEILPVKIGESVTVGLMSFGKKTYNFDLQNMPYRVVGFANGSPTLLRLEREKDTDWDDITEFFNEIFALNAGKLKPCFADAIKTARSRLFEDIYASHVPTIPFFLSRDKKGNLRVSHVVVSEFTSELADFFYLDRNFLDYRALNDPSALAILDKALNEGTAIEQTWYFFKEDDKESGKTVIRSALSGTLGNHDAQIAFIRDAFRSGEYRFMSVRLAPVARPNSQLINSAIDPLAEVALPESTALKVENDAVVAIGEFVDITRDIRQALGT